MSDPWTEIRQQFEAMRGHVKLLEEGQAATSAALNGIAAVVSSLDGRVTVMDGRVTALEKPKPPTPPPPPDPDALTAADLDYLGYFLLPKRTPEDAAQPDATLRQFAYTDGVACLGPKGLIVSGHAHGTYLAEVTIPEPSLTDPPRAEFIQNFADVGREAIGEKARFIGLLHDEEWGLIISFLRWYNVAHAQFPNICWGPVELAKHRVVEPASRFSRALRKMASLVPQSVRSIVARTARPMIGVQQGTPLFRVTDAEGQLVDSERCMAPLVKTPWGLAFVNQRGKHQAKSGGPALATFRMTENGPTDFRQLLHYPMYPDQSDIFPDPQNHWNLASSCSGAVMIDGQLVFTGQVGLATGLPELIGKNVYYGGSANYPVPGVSTCGGSKGYHAPPYKTRLWPYDPDDIANAELPSDPMPLNTINLSADGLLGETDCGFAPGQPVWDETTRRLYLIQGGTSEPKVHVISVKKRGE